LAVSPLALTGPNMPSSVEVQEGSQVAKIHLLAPGAASEAELAKYLAQAKASGRTVIAIDFTHPSAVNPNSELYCRLGLPFVMGTTGGDRERLMQVVKDSALYALIAPNMCKQIVAFQATMESMAHNYPGSFGGYSLKVVESHQKEKADTSGTAKKMVEYFNALKGGEAVQEKDIVMLRQADKQLAFGVPAEALPGHAWHTYTLTSSDGSVIFEFKHNVCGRSTYAEGVVDAVRFLAKQIADRTDKKLFDMIDVLRAGAMH
jgi:4-hydroxy-tetrahydrodipicolinate reductase